MYLMQYTDKRFLITQSFDIDSNQFFRLLSLDIASARRSSTPQYLHLNAPRRVIYAEQKTKDLLQLLQINSLSSRLTTPAEFLRANIKSGSRHSKVTFDLSVLTRCATIYQRRGGTIKINARGWRCLRARKRRAAAEQLRSEPGVRDQLHRVFTRAPPPPPKARATERKLRSHK